MKIPTNNVIFSFTPKRVEDLREFNIETGLLNQVASLNVTAASLVSTISTLNSERFVLDTYANVLMSTANDFAANQTLSAEWAAWLVAHPLPPRP